MKAIIRDIFDRLKSGVDIIKAVINAASKRFDWPTVFNIIIAGLLIKMTCTTRHLCSAWQSFYIELNRHYYKTDNVQTFRVLVVVV